MRSLRCSIATRVCSGTPISRSLSHWPSAVSRRLTTSMLDAPSDPEPDELSPAVPFSRKVLRVRVVVDSKGATAVRTLKGGGWAASPRGGESDLACTSDVNDVLAGDSSWSSSSWGSGSAVLVSETGGGTNGGSLRASWNDGGG